MRLPEADKWERPPPFPHVLDFHDLRFPECLAFWVLMILCFGVGFIPQRQKDESLPGEGERGALAP